MRFLRASLAALFAPLALGACATAPAAPQTPETITLARGPCFGFCPDYTVTIGPDGAIVFQGRRFVEQPGEHRAQADPAALEALRARIRAADLFALRDRYAANITDIPEYRLTYTVGARTKTIVDYGGPGAGMPDIVRQIEDEIDRVAGSARWIGRGGQPGKPR